MVDEPFERPMSRRQLLNGVADIAERLGLFVQRNFVLGQTIWGERRKIDLLVTDSYHAKHLGVVCRFQDKSGTTYEKVPLTLDDIEAWPMRGIVVYEGDGFTEGFRGFLRARGNAIAFEEFDSWLRMFFGLETSDSH